MQYLLMCCFDEKKWDAIPESQRGEIMKEYSDWVAGTAKTGHYRGGAKLRSTASATTLRAKNGKPVVVDGPFAETKEQLGGYHVIDCSDLDEALAIAKRIPTLRVGGTIEVRPLDHAVQA
jgi:hypothetical protein